MGRKKGKKSQYIIVLDTLEKVGGRLTQLAATNLFGCLRLGAIICKMRKEGINVITERLSDVPGNPARYFIPKDSKGKRYQWPKGKKW